ncbi:hypothetical protein [Bradyrhizobium sp. Ash2021]|uniref:hypothetical protein n=1 Tax=Bradyrhizobium sp. Ash2021 TaxID=2954771 RepID=UPI00281639EC|nr:hypothetical protein [Bradyrhizobium sp. Ash2021]WMT78618.1 hypothetical protein NL528_20760 [Bradyrhizobium sp. Ash2021]
MIMDESELQYGELNYEKRIVAYFDVLGWCSEIEQAANDPRRIARIAMVPKLFSRGVSQMAAQASGSHLTSFSDNVIVSAPYTADRLQSSLDGLATIQLGAALAGFWLRGGITIGPPASSPDERSDIRDNSNVTPDIAEPVIGRKFARPVGPSGRPSLLRSAQAAFAAFSGGAVSMARM